MATLDHRLGYNGVMSAPTHTLPFTYPHLAGIGGKIKLAPKDFVVSEILPWPISGQGDYLYLYIEKTDVSHRDLLQRIAKVLDIEERDIGYAGQKDKAAITRQWISVPKSSEAESRKIRNDAITILERGYHHVPLRRGELKANEFDIVLHDIDPDSSQHVSPLTLAIDRFGLANFYGAQRFSEFDTLIQLGLLILMRKEKFREDWRHRFALSVVQSMLFNEYIIARNSLGNLKLAMAGDLVASRYGGLSTLRDPGIFRVDQHILTGPMFGARCTAPVGDALKLEDQILETWGLKRSSWSHVANECPGTRRSLIMQPQNLTTHVESKTSLRLTFALPAGSYATVLLAEYTEKPISYSLVPLKKA